MSQAILDFEHVVVKDEASGEVVLNDLHLSLAPGELVFVLLREGDVEPPVAELALGLITPNEGQVFFNGKNWVQMSPSEAAHNRGRIGRVFSERGWISNLDVDENITLGQWHHTVRSTGDMETETLDLAQRFGFTELPRLRPALLKPSELRRAQWIRAFLGGPLLAVLAHPMRDVYEDFKPALNERVNFLRAGGGACLWFLHESDWDERDAAGERTTVVQLKQGVLSPVKRRKNG